LTSTNLAEISYAPKLASGLPDRGFTVGDNDAEILL
jgi:hypothetical protein